MVDMRARRGVAFVLAVCAVALSGCGARAAAGAVDGSFNFVAPGGQTAIFYDPPEQRGSVGEVSGESLSEAGRTIKLSDFAGQVVVLNVWGSWCGPCRLEAPGLQQVYQDQRGAGVALLGVDVRDDRQAAADFVRDRGLTYPSIFDPPARSLLGLRGLPRNTVPLTVVLDRRHRVAAVFLTALRVSELMPVVRRVAAEPQEGGSP